MVRKNREEAQRTLWKANQAAARLNIGLGAFLARVRRGEIRAVRMGTRLIRFDPDDIEEYVSMSKGAATQDTDGRDSQRQAGTRLAS
ncbi:excisionase family DNA-binding protein [Planctomycetota bacterium]